MSKAWSWINCSSWWESRWARDLTVAKYIFFFFLRSSPDFRCYGLPAGFLVRWNMVSPPHVAVFLAGRTLLKGMLRVHKGPGKKFQCLHTSPHNGQKWQFNAQRFFGTNLYVQIWSSNSKRAHQAPSWILLIWKKGTLTISQHLAMLCLSWENREPAYLLREEKRIKQETKQFSA